MILQDLFNRFAPVIESDIIKNFGFVPIDADAGRGKIDEILRELNGYDLNGNQIRVQKSTSGYAGFCFCNFSILSQFSKESGKVAKWIDVAAGSARSPGWARATHATDADGTDTGHGSVPSFQITTKEEGMCL